MPRGGRLGNTEKQDEIADAELTVAQEIQDPQARRIREAAEELINELESHPALYSHLRI